MTKMLQIPKMKDKKKAQSGGLITGLIFGIASLVIITIISFIIVDTLFSAQLFDTGEVTTTVTNETNNSAGTSGLFAYVNSTGYMLDHGGASYNDDSYNYRITAIWAEQNGIYNVSIATANATVNSTGFVLNTTGAIWNAVLMDNVSITYSYDNITDSNKSATEMGGNLSIGTGNVSEQLPTVLLIAAIVLILGILVLLVGAWQRMRLGGNI